MLFKSSNNVGLPWKENFSKAFPEAHFGCLLLSANYMERVSITLSGILRLFNWIKTFAEGRANFHTATRFNLMIVLASRKLIFDLIVNLVDWAIKPNLTFQFAITASNSVDMNEGKPTPMSFELATSLKLKKLATSFEISYRAHTHKLSTLSGMQN